MPTVAEIVNIYPIAQYLAANDLPTKGLYAGGKNILLPQKIYNIGKTVKRIFDADPTDTTLPDTANFLWTLCGIYGQKALSVISDPGSIPGIAPIPGYEYYNLIDTIGVSGNDLSTYQNDLLIGGRQINVFTVNGGVPQYLGINFNFDAATGEISWLGGNHFFTGDVIAIPYLRLV